MSRPVARRLSETKGSYANYFEIGHTAFEFVLDFGEAYAGSEPPPCHTRIVTSPVYVLALLDLLQKSVADFQSQFGPIRGEQ
jgi:hypothetical protein